MSIPHNIFSVSSVPLCPLLFSTVCPLSVSTSRCTTRLFCVTMPTDIFQHICAVCQYLTLYRMLVLCSVSTAVFYSPSTLCRYLTEYRPYVLCHLVHCCLHMPVQCLSVPHNVPSVGSVSVCPILSSTVSQIPVNTSRDTFCFFFCFTVFTAVFSILSTVC